MGGSLRPLVSRRAYDFSNIVTNGQTVATVVHRSVDITQADAAELCVRIHEISNDSAGNVIRVVAKPVGISPQEPDLDFLADEVAAVEIGTSGENPAGTLLIDALTSPFGSAIQLSVEGVRTADDTVTATISVDLLIRD